MDAVDIAYAGVARQLELLAAGTLTAREITQVYLDRIERYDSELNAFRVIYAERALTEADQADARRKAGDQRPLLGIPVAIKDDMDLAGDITAFGTSAHGPAVAADAEVVKRLRAAGAVIIGKTNVPELTITPFTESPTFGKTRNPWDPSRTSGGSSGGSATAVSAGLVSAAVASDGGGSIRIPAGCVGIFGLKPQNGAVPTAPKVDPWRGLSTWGVLTRGVADAALVYDVIKDPEDSWTQAAATPSERPLRVAISRSVPFGVTTKVDAEQLSALDNAGAILRGLGHEVVERGAPWGRALPHFLARYFRGIADDAEHMAHPEKLSDWTKAYARWGRLMPAWLVRRSLRKAIEDRERFARFLQEFDVIVTPQFTSRPIKVGAWDGKGAFAAYIGFSGWVPFNAAFNHTGQPAMVVPVGFAPDGFPLVVQIVGAPDGDAALLSLAAQMQGARDWTAERPPNFA